MKKVHATLSPAVNAMFIVLWALVTFVLTSMVEPHRAAWIAVVGAILGAIVGMMQHWSFVEAREGFAAAGSLMDIRRAFKATPWGRRYFQFLYLSKLILLLTAIVLVRAVSLEILVAYLAGYISLMFVREIVTLRDVFVLARFARPAE